MAEAAVQPSARPATRTMSYNQLTSCPDMEPEFRPIYEAARPFTMTSLERMYGLWQAARYVVSHQIPGDFVECGVWKGGSAMVAAMSLMQAGDVSRGLWLYDTFEGMTQPGERDVDWSGRAAAEHLVEKKMTADQWCRSPLDEVKAAMASTGYAGDRIHYVAGRVEQTIPAQMPERIALLRLDTDWYESTKHELEHLFPRLVSGGVILIDDYGHWQGCRQAVDEYMAKHGVRMLLSRLDYTGRMGIKP
jgi:hypothetical protein